MPSGGHHDHPKEHAIDFYDIHVWTEPHGGVAIFDHRGHDDALSGDDVDLDDPANAASILDVCRAIAERCPKQYITVAADLIENDGGLTFVDDPIDFTGHGAPGDGQR